MHEPVAPRQDVDERTETGDVHDLAGVDRPDLDLGREHDRPDPLLGGGDRSAVRGGNRDPGTGGVLVDHDLGAGLLLQSVDDLALGADDLADLVGRDLEGEDLGGRLADVRPRGVDGAAHHLQNLEPCLAGLFQGRGQHRGGDPVDLGVELQRRDVLLGARHLEVHVAEGVLGAEDVGESHVAVALVDEAHGDPGDRRLDGNAGIHERQARAAHRGHGAGAVGGQHLRDQPDGVRELIEARNDRQQRLLGERSVADLPPARPAHETRLAGAEGREVVVVQVALALGGVDAVHDLVHALGAERGDVEDLRLAALEQPRAVGHGDHTHLGRQRPQVAGAPAVDAAAV